MNIPKTQFLQSSLRLVCLVSVLFALLAGSSSVYSAAAKASKPAAKVAPKGRETKASKSDRTKDVPKSSAKNNAVSKARQRESVSSKQRDRVNAKERDRVSSKAPARSGSALTKRQRAVELQRLEAKRKAERLAAIARERNRDEDLRDSVQSMIAADDLTGEDSEVRRSAVSALGDHAGTVVVMNPQTGRIYSIVNQQWAVREGFKPCSTIKLVTGLAGLNEKVIDPSDTTKISDNNQVSLTKALAYSKNEYFQQVGGQVGYDRMISYARRLGLGEKTGINERNEFPGHLPSLKSGVALNRMSSHGDDFKVTALQLATLVSAIANGGKLVTPYVAHTRQQENNFKVKIRRQVKIDPDSWQQMLPGMVGAVNYGSGRRAHDPFQTVAGKTGTCIDEGTWVGLFTSYAPIENPRLAVVVIARGADGQSHFPAAVAGRIYRDLNGRFGVPDNLQVAKVRATYAPERAELVADDEQSEAATARNANSSAQPLVRKTVANSSLRPVLMQIPKRNQKTEKTVGGSKVPTSSNSEGQTRPRRVLTER